MKYFMPVFVMCLVVFGGVASAMTAGERQTITQVENYLRHLDTLKSRFVQTTYDGQQTQGTFYLDRPGKLRFEYDPPLKDFIVADGLFIYFYDAEMKQQSNAPIGTTLADFILRKETRLDGDVTVTDVFDQDDFITVTVTQTADPGAGSLVLGFDKNPLRLRGWRILDAQGLMTEIELTSVETGVPLSRKLFYYHDPERQKPQYN